MNTLILRTEINAPLERCFQLSTSIDLHKLSAVKSKEEAIDGKTKGLIKLTESVTWKAKHFGVWFTMKVKITEYEPPEYFVDEMIEGPFKSMTHRHEFKKDGNRTIMLDKFDFLSPFGLLGKMVDYLIFRKYMYKFLQERNQLIVEFAETEKWKKVLI